MKSEDGKTRLPRHARRHRLAHDDDQRPRRPRLGRRRHRGRGGDARPAGLDAHPAGRRLEAHGRAARGRDGDRPRAHRHARCSARRASSASSSSSSAPASRSCRSPTARRSPTWRPSTARPAASSRSTPRRSATCASPAAPRRRSSSSRRTARSRASSTRRARPRRCTPTRWSSTSRRSSRASPGPTRPQDRVQLAESKTSFHASLEQAASRRRRSRAPPTRRRTATIDGKDVELTHGAVVIAAITSCTNTSNPSVLVAAGLLAKKAVEKGLDAQAVGEDEPRARVEGRHRVPRARRGSRRTSRSSASTWSATAARPASATAGRCPSRSSKAIEQGDLVAAAVLSGNRNFEGRVHAEVRANYLASPPLVVAYALAGTMDIDPYNEPLGTGNDGKPVFLKDIWPTRAEVQAAIDAVHRPRDVRAASTATSSTATSEWKKLDGPDGRPLRVGREVDLREAPAVLRRDDAASPAPIADITGARVLARPRRQHHDRPHLAGRLDQEERPGGQVPHRARRRRRRTSTRTASRRGNDEVMVRGTFANIRLRNLLAPGTEGGVTRHLPSGDAMSIFDAAGALREGRRARSSSSPARNTARARRATGRRRGRSSSASARHRRELRAHPPQQPRRHGHPAAPVLARRERGVARPHRAKRRSPSRASPTPSPRARSPCARSAPTGRQARVRRDRPDRYPAGARVLPARRHPPVRPPPAPQVLNPKPARRVPHCRAQPSCAAARRGGPASARVRLVSLTEQRAQYRRCKWRSESLRTPPSSQGTHRPIRARPSRSRTPIPPRTSSYGDCRPSRC